MTDLTPTELRSLADRIESQNCTGVAATWCPVHGDCICKDDNRGYPSHNGPGCPLHDEASSHAEAELENFRD